VPSVGDRGWSFPQVHACAVGMVSRGEFRVEEVPEEEIVSEKCAKLRMQFVVSETLTMVECCVEIRKGLATIPLMRDV
jgi:hypothetical protein